MVGKHGVEVTCPAYIGYHLPTFGAEFVRARRRAEGLGS
jgi:hypothetical protein